jgi:hypothetical protein
MAHGTSHPGAIPEARRHLGCGMTGELFSFPVVALR